MRSYVTPNCLKRIQNTKGEILARINQIVLVKTLDIYTVWNCEDGFIFCHTFYHDEAWKTFNKFAFSLENNPQPQEENYFGE